MPTVQKITCRTNEQWRHERAKSVGASAIGTIIGINPYESASKLAATMRAELNGIFDYSETTAMLRGHFYEGGVAQFFSLRTGHQIIQSSAAEVIYRRDDLPFLHASTDRTYWIDNDGPKHGDIAETNKGVVECKTTQKVVKDNKRFLCWLLQLQTQMGVTGYHHGHLAWDVLSKAEGVGHKFVPYNEKVFNAIVDVTHDFWHRSIIGGEAPRSSRDIYKRYPFLFSHDDWFDVGAATAVKPKSKAEYAPTTDDEERDDITIGCSTDNLTCFEKIIKILKK